jgi:hypothetical protein
MKAASWTMASRIGLIAVVAVSMWLASCGNDDAMGPIDDADDAFEPPETPTRHTPGIVATPTSTAVPSDPPETPTRHIPGIVATPTSTAVASACGALPGEDEARTLVGCADFVGAHDRSTTAGITFRAYLTIAPDASVATVPDFPRRPAPRPTIPGDPVEYPLDRKAPLYAVMTVSLEALGFEVEAPQRTLRLGASSRIVEWQLRSDSDARGIHPATVRVYAGPAAEESNLVVLIPMEIDIQAPPRSVFERTQQLVTDTNVIVGGLSSIAAAVAGVLIILKRRSGRGPRRDKA